MAWSTPHTWAIGEVVTASMMNSHVRDQLRYLKGSDGPITLDHRLHVPLATTPTGAGLRFGNDTNQYSSVQGLDLGGASYAYFLINRYYDGAAWQQLNTREGGLLQLAQDAMTYYTFPAASSTPTERFRITNTGNLGLGTNNPYGKLHAVGSLGRWLMYEFDGLDGTTRVIVPDGAGDVLYGAQLWSITRASNGVVQIGNAGGTVFTPGVIGTLYSDGGTNAAAFRVLANGQIEIQRTAGSLTYKVALMIQWI